MTITTNDEPLRAPQAWAAEWEKIADGREYLDIGEGCEVRWVCITPQIARALLLLNTHNRPRHQPTETKLIGAMKRGEFLPRNGTTIVVSRDLVLLDGQTRLHSIVVSGDAQWMLLVTGADDATQLTIDKGRSRTTGNQFHLLGIPNSNVAAGAMRAIFYYERTATFRRGTPDPTDAQLVELVRRYDGVLRDAIRLTRQKVTGIPPSTAAAVGALILRADSSDGAIFLDRLATGANLPLDDPIFVLRRQSLATIGRGGHIKIEAWHTAALMIKAWNFWISGTKIKLLRFSTGGANPELFPLVEGLDLRADHPHPETLDERHP